MENVIQDEIISSTIDDYKPLQARLKCTDEAFHNAIRFATLAQLENQSYAWTKVFPDRYTKLVESNKYNDSEIKQRIARYASAYKCGKVVSAVIDELTKPNYLIYSEYRSKAMDKLLDLIDGKAAPTLVPIYEQIESKDEHGAIKRNKKGNIIFENATDEYGRTIQKVDHNGEPVFQEYFQKVSPLVQMQSASKILDATALPADKKIELGIDVDADISAQQKVLSVLESLGKTMRENYVNGQSLDDVQRIGHNIEREFSSGSNDIVDIEMDE